MAGQKQREDPEIGQDKKVKPERAHDLAEGEVDTVEESIEKHEEKKDQNS